METATAIKLIEGGVNITAAAQFWADLGAGKGLFTNALASLLSRSSVVYAIDRDLNEFKIPPDKKGKIEIMKKDFVKDDLMLVPLDGILMANALHYVPNAGLFLKGIRTSLKPGGNFILVEYDMNVSNQWVPYPIPYSGLNKIADAAGFTSVTRLGETPSTYNRANIYSALLQ